MRALLSVYDKTGVEDLARGLSDLGWELVSSGGTSDALAAAGIAHVEVADLTGAPEMLGGRVKTLHPTIHGGILADRSKPEHMADVERRGIGLIDLVVCNLYPFSSDPSIELIDVGGPTMVRAAAKNHAHVGIVVELRRLRRGPDELRSGRSSSCRTGRGGVSWPAPPLPTARRTTRPSWPGSTPPPGPPRRLRPLAVRPMSPTPSPTQPSRPPASISPCPPASI